ncbi:hypothetical protein LXL04_032873 [Taraxacum kok-saghyz]
MASSFGKKKDKGPKKVYVQDSESDEDGVDIGFFDFSEETFKPTLNSCDDPFLNLLCDESLLRSVIDRMRADTGEPDLKETEQPQINEVNQEQVGVEYRVHDSSMPWDEMRPVLEDCYESPEQLKFALTNYAVKNGYQLYFEKSDRIRIIAKNYSFGSLVTSTWLAKHFLKDIIMKPKLSLVEMKEDIFRRFSIHVSIGQCQRGRVEARNLLEGKLEEHYARVWDYAAALLGPVCEEDDDATEGEEFDGEGGSILDQGGGGMGLRRINRCPVFSLLWLLPFRARRNHWNRELRERTEGERKREALIGRCEEEEGERKRAVVSVFNGGGRRRRCDSDLWFPSRRKKKKMEEEELELWFPFGTEEDAKTRKKRGRFYVCFKNFKDGWIRGCRRVIGLDGCFLKGRVNGELLTAIGRDADNHVYPIAWAVVDVENIDNWNWFLDLLVDDLDRGSGNGLVVISDQHKGLLGAVSQQLPYVEHRQCARHIFANFSKRDMLEGGYDADEIFYTLGIVDAQVDVQVDAEVDAQVVGEVEARVDAELPIQKKRKPSERILKGKLKKFGPDKDGGRSTKDKAWVLE